MSVGGGGGGGGGGKGKKRKYYFLSDHGSFGHALDKKHILLNGGLAAVTKAGPPVLVVRS